jgi:AraC-like DNA-binding protein
MQTSSSPLWKRGNVVEASPPRVVVLRAVRRGAEVVAATRSLRLDADVYLVLDATVPFASTCEPRTESVAVELTAPPQREPRSFLPVLRSIRGPVGERLAQIAERRPRDRSISLAASEAADWWSALEQEERSLRERASRIRCVRPATRETLFRRLLLCADFIQTHYERQLNVDLLAAVSHLSPFHFARLFALVMEETPHAFLVRKRLAVARRLLASGLGHRDAAERAGFGCRSTLFRHLRETAAARS